MGEFSREVIGLTSGLFRRAAAPEQAGVFAGLNPATYNPNDPFVLWVIQSTIIIGMTQLLSLGLSRMRQPRVIAEVITGVLLGPSVMGRIPNFSATIFPQQSLSMLTLTATIGLVFFLFLVGMEIDLRVVQKNAKAATAISVAGLIVPLGLGAALAVPLYHQFIDESVNYGYFILFVAVAVGITAFPVLCRILTEVKLLDTTVGILVLSAGVGNDVVGWVLLALTVALVNASNGVTALYVLLTGVGFVLFLLLPVRWAFTWVARRTGSLEKGEPTALMMTLTFVIVLFSAFFTDIIGIHPIFGGFLAGLIIPKENGFAISLVEKLEDVIGLLFLPQYFVLSGLKTNLGLLNNGITWGYTVLICVVAFSAKFISCAAAAKSFGFNLRESGAVGSLMACKGLVELIVLNVGLSAHVLNTRVFSMFVLHALVLTFITTPLTIWIYPARVRTHASASLEHGLHTSAKDVAAGDLPSSPSDDTLKTKFALILENLEQLPAVMMLTQMLQAPSSAVAVTTSSSDLSEKALEGTELPRLPVLASRPQTISVDALRLIELTERTSTVLKSQTADILMQSDSVLSIFRTFGRINKFSVSTSLSVVSHDEYYTSVADHAREFGSHMVIVPWNLTPAFAQEHSSSSSSSPIPYNPFDALFHKSAAHDATPSIHYSQFVRKVFANSPTDVALFVDRGVAHASTSASPHIFFPFFGGPDDRLALSFVVQLCINGAITATVMRVQKTEANALTPMNSIEIAKHEAQFTSHGNTIGFPDTLYGQRDTQTRIQSDTMDSLVWSRFTSPTAQHSADVASALTRITFEHEYTSQPLHTVLDRVAEQAKHYAASSTPKPLFVVAGRSRRMAVESHHAELRQLLSEHNTSLGSEVPKTFGEVATAFVATGVNVSLIVLQSAASS
ncbi:cation/H+ exchanger [Artomyces pyxidatus]|uniref:Cation/H+ exchanger n=1 Tax=Artomyces pyxidatus TaxID=48021 RepID=A0ACB8SSR4_9AGAM|nr:cation/H+ exchanger [Artomyces pyxidatus]